MPAPLAIPLATGVLGFFDWLSKNGASNDAVGAQTDALNKAQGAIQQGADKAMGYQQPYLQNAGQDYARQRGLVQGGYYQTPYDKSFQGQSYAPSGFNFNPSQGGASFAPWQPQGGPASYTPARLPSQAGFAPPSQPQQQQTQAPAQMPNPTNQAALQQQVYQIMLRENPQANMSQMQLPGPSPQNQGLMNYNPQTGQGNPLVGQGYKPPDPKIPTLQDYYNLVRTNPWIKGRSGPLEGGMPTGGLLGGIR